ncbi:MAG TPA: DUF1292 domain-containing protein [Clostridiaceae bacterium]|nr:DUF1292 domain-containing protein [Clostridiaceae bacterium]
MSEERDNIIVLVDEDGEETEFELIDSFEFNGNEYVVLLPAVSYEEDYDEEEEVVILRVERNENDEESFVNIEDDDELDSVFEEFKSRMEDEYDFYDEQ